MEFTCCIDEDTIEHEAMNRLQDALIKHHIDKCGSCQLRVSESRDWIGAVKLALRELQEAQERQGTPDNPYGSSPESGA
jgi:hypothetical protein